MGVLWAGIKRPRVHPSASVWAVCVGQSQVLNFRLLVSAVDVSRKMPSRCVPPLRCRTPPPASDGHQRSLRWTCPRYVWFVGRYGGYQGTT